MLHQINPHIQAGDIDGQIAIRLTKTTMQDGHIVHVHWNLTTQEADDLCGILRGILLNKRQKEIHDEQLQKLNQWNQDAADHHRKTRQNAQPRRTHLDGL